MSLGLGRWCGAAGLYRAEAYRDTNTNKNKNIALSAASSIVSNLSKATYRLAHSKRIIEIILSGQKAIHHFMFKRGREASHHIKSQTNNERC